MKTRLARVVRKTKAAIFIASRRYKTRIDAVGKDVRRLFGIHSVSVPGGRCNLAVVDFQQLPSLLICEKSLDKRMPLKSSHWVLDGDKDLRIASIDHVDSLEHRFDNVVPLHSVVVPRVID